MTAGHERFDYVIVGAGSAGCVLANRLSADPSTRVCLIEAGGTDWNPWIHVPVGYYYTLGRPSADWRFRTEPDDGLGSRTLTYPRGRVLGGTSSINGMVYIRGQAADFDGWRQQGNIGWSWEDVLPYFRKSEDQARGASKAHGTGGELHVEDLRVSWSALDAFCEAAVETGIPRVADFNAGDNDGVGYFQVTQKNGWRMSAARAFLRPVRRRPNLTIRTKAQAVGIRLRDKRAVSVDYRQRGINASVEADGEVILAAGAIGSPHLLQLSGVGDARALLAHGIRPLHDLPGVGLNLQDHLTVRSMYRLGNAKTLNQQLSSMSGRVGMALQYALFRRGPMTMSPGIVAAFVKSDASQATADLQLVGYPLTYEALGDPPHQFSGISLAVWLLRPESRGSIRLRSPDPYEAPAIKLNLLSARRDRDKAVAGLKMIRTICAAPAMAKMSAVEFVPGPGCRTDHELADAVSRYAGAAFHTSGTCKMGQDAYAVVDERLRVRGINGLRVVDASIMPTIVSGNTNAAAIMIGEKGAAMILEDRRR